eukprot:3826551-Heterocapsa_arctica.AAC.1
MKPFSCRVVKVKKSFYPPPGLEREGTPRGKAALFLVAIAEARADQFEKEARTAQDAAAAAVEKSAAAVEKARAARAEAVEAWREFQGNCIGGAPYSSTD